MRSVDTWVCSLPLSQWAGSGTTKSEHSVSKERSRRESTERFHLSNAKSTVGLLCCPVSSTFPSPAWHQPECWDLLGFCIFPKSGSTCPTGCLGLGDPQGIPVESPWIDISFFFFTEPSKPKTCLGGAHSVLSTPESFRCADSGGKLWLQLTTLLLLEVEHGQPYRKFRKHKFSYL